MQLVLQLLLKVNLRRGLPLLLRISLLILVVVVILLVGVIRLFGLQFLIFFRSCLLPRLTDLLGQRRIDAFDLVNLLLVMVNLLMALVKVMLQLGNGALLALQLLLKLVNLSLLSMTLLFARMLVLHLAQPLLLLGHVLLESTGRFLQLYQLALHVLLGSQRLV